MKAILWCAGNWICQVGFQVRFILGKSYDKHNNIANSNILNCSLEQGFLPQVFENFSSAPALPQKKTKRIVVFIASLYPGLKEFLTSYYLKHRTISGDNVAVVQLTQTTRQMTSTEEDWEALVEILCLSFSNTLFVTGSSTFGGLAQAYGATVPWFLSFKELEADRPSSCTRGQTIDICFQLANPKYTCPHDPKLNNKHIVESVPYFKACLDVDSGGVQLVTPNRTDSSESPVT